MEPFAWVAALVAAVMMMRSGMLKRQLVPRRSLSRCPSCGRARSRAVCAYCARR